MAIIIVQPNQKLSNDDFEKTKEYYESYIKITIDLANEIVALGGKWHYEAEKILLESGSKQDNIWGGGIDLEPPIKFEANAMVNIRPGRNDSTEILNEKLREKFVKIAQKTLKDYVK